MSTTGGARSSSGLEQSSLPLRQVHALMLRFTQASPNHSELPQKTTARSNSVRDGSTARKRVIQFVAFLGTNVNNQINKSSRCNQTKVCHYQPQDEVQQKRRGGWEPTQGVIQLFSCWIQLFLKK